jgi:hypothetical protein
MSLRPRTGAVVPGTERFTLASGVYTSNCVFASTATSPSPTPGWFAFDEALMLGIGVGFDTKGSDKGLVVHQPGDEKDMYMIPDTREGWSRASSAAGLRP